MEYKEKNHWQPCKGWAVELHLYIRFHKGTAYRWIAITSKRFKWRKKNTPPRHINIDSRLAETKF